MIMRATLLIIVALAISFGGFKPTQDEPLPQHGLLWKITGNDLKYTSYLFGTYHNLGGMQILDSIKTFDSIFHSTSLLICEAQLSDLAELRKQKMLTKPSRENNFLKPWPVTDSTYENLLTAKQKDILDSAVNSNEMVKKLKQVNPNMRPTQLLSLFKYLYNAFENKTALKISKDYLYPNDTAEISILDVYFQRLAKKNGMKIVSLDSLEEYLKIQDSIYNLHSQLSYKTEIDILIYYIENHLTIDSLIQDKTNRLLSLYLKQDIGFILNYNKQQQEEFNFNNDQFLSLGGDVNYIEKRERFMLYERNNHWMKKIPGLLKEGSCFIAVGAGHLAGENGLINQLRGLDFTVVPVTENSN